MQESPASPAPRNEPLNIAAVIFDYGLVLARCPTIEEFGLMAKMFNVPYEGFYELWENSRNPYDRGDITADEYWHGLASQTNTSLDREQIETLRKIEIEIWVHLDPQMLAWTEKLRDAGMKTAILSNMPLDLAEYVRKNFRWLDHFAFKTLSAEVRTIKPEPAIYEHTLRGLGVAADQALFIDDRERNIEAARKLGIHGILYESLAQLKGELVKMDFPVLPDVTETSSQVSSVAERAQQSREQEIKFQL
ncbi:MAG: HAD family phosphatase [Terriglobales bacterium]|jgi:putative hydrolase of the HAD superfamily